eukprot:5047722-Prymnesium_polylepis.2
MQRRSDQRVPTDRAPQQQTQRRGMKRKRLLRHPTLRRRPRCTARERSADPPTPHRARCRCPTSRRANSWGAPSCGRRGRHVRRRHHRHRLQVGGRSIAPRASRRMQRPDRGPRRSRQALPSSWATSAAPWATSAAPSWEVAATDVRDQRAAGAAADA